MISEPIMMSAMNFARAAIREADRTIPPIDAPVEIAVGGHVLASERDLRAVVTGPRDDAGGLATRRWTDEQRCSDSWTISQLGSMRPSRRRCDDRYAR